eukprot:15350181-Ditylum_brightwellii.AAC.2
MTLAVNLAWLGTTRKDTETYQIHVWISTGAATLGIKLDCQRGGTIELKQLALIQCIIDDVGFQNANDKATPTEVAELPADVDGPRPGPQDIWFYSYVVEMLVYMASTTRPEISMAVHQCAQYSHNPQRCHEKEIKHIVHYLISMMDTYHGKDGFHGMIVEPADDLTLDCCCDANFAGIWGQKMTRTHCVSKLQLEIACPTMEAKHIALSHAMQGLLPVCWLLEELAEALQLERDSLSTISMTWEDNNEAMSLATSPLPCMTPRSKHIMVKYHWFCWLIDGLTACVRPITSALQKADILTKPLGNIEFATKRKMLLGW